MIHDFSSVLKDISEWEKEVSDLDPSTLRSPNNGSVGNGQRHSVYERFVIPDSEHVYNPLVIHIPVFKFPISRKTFRYHAFLPDWVCPFLSFTYPFIIEILSFYFGEGARSKRKTANRFNISRTSVYTILNHFEARHFEMSRLPARLQCMMDPVEFARQLKEERLLLSSALRTFIAINIRPFMVIKTDYSQFGQTRPYHYSPHGGNPIR